jgi:L-threonylcarbamoyladenylate synthase
MFLDRVGRAMVLVLNVDPARIDISVIKCAVEYLKAGELIIYPTDTVYGLGADALNVEAVHKVFEAKRRPPGQPLPVAVSGIRMAENLAEVGEDARRLMRAFWPGALTIVLPKRRLVPDIVTGGEGSIALRAPNHQIPLRLIEESGFPLIATSANLHGWPNPKSALEAQAQIGSKVGLVLDAGPSSGKPSTVIDMTATPPKILRQGPITREELSRVLLRRVD